MLITDRLSLKPLTPADVPELFSIYRDEQAMQFMPMLPHQRVEQTILHFQIDMSRSGAKYWAIRLKGENRIIGIVNFLGETRFPGMGYIIEPASWGHGYATEASRAALDYGFHELNYDRVELWIDEANDASHRVAEKLGFQIKGRIPQKFSHRAAYHFMAVYGTMASDWLQDEVVQPQTPRIFSVEPVLLVHDVVETAAFFQDKLGFQLDFMYGDPATHAAVSHGEWTGNTVTIQLSQVPKDQVLTPSGYLYILMDTKLDAVFENYRGQGVEIAAEPKTQPWGMREFVIKDINGHAIVFGTHA